MSVDALGKQLVPYLETLSKKEDDEVLFALAEQLGHICTIVPQQQLLQILEILE